MTDKELIKQEIERKMEDVVGAYESEDTEYGYKQCCKEILNFIDSIQEPASEDLEEEIERCWKEMFPNGWSDYTLLTLTYEEHKAFAHHFAEWQKQQMKEALQTEYEKGRFDMREEMMKDAVEDCSIIFLSDNKNWLQIPGANLVKALESFKQGDKVKIIIVKEEQQ